MEESREIYNRIIRKRNDYRAVFVVTCETWKFYVTGRIASVALLMKRRTKTKLRPAVPSCHGRR